ncbi:MAG: class I SAM-dependent methyltransferase [Cytophagales bacterium]|nr:MAG: class I SAM-dependent methyltransferase [Cytophagales bacterium]
MLKKLILRVLNPIHFFKIIYLSYDKKRINRVFADEQLKFYSKILPTDFLHYGYFDDKNIKPEDISVAMIYKAQVRYAELLLEKVVDKNNQILDIGCGMGGLVKMMLEQNLKPVALTPDQTQIKHISEKYHTLKVYPTKFEDIPLEENLDKYGTVITSESLQYLDLDKSLEIINQILKKEKDSRWIACDYFKINQEGEKSGHNWSNFISKLDKSGFKLTYEYDITPHILPTISYVYFMANNIGLPSVEFAIDKLKVKKKGIYYLIEPSLNYIFEKINKNLKTVNPVEFAKTKKYVLMVIERK